MKKKGLEILPPSLQAEMEAFKAQEDEKYRVDALMRFTRKLYMGLKPTARNFEAIMADLFFAILCWMSGEVEKDDSPIGFRQRDPYKEEIQWLIPLREFFHKFNCREYLVKSKDFKIIDRAISRLRDGLCWFGEYFCSSVWHRACQEGDWWVNTSDIGRRSLWLENIIGALDDIEDLVEEAVWADESSYLSQAWRKLEDELRRMAGLPSKQKPAAAADSEQKPLAAAEPPVAKGSSASEGDSSNEAAKNAEWKKLLVEMAEDARNPMVRADICVRWEDAKRTIGTRQTKEMKRENFNNVLNFVNKYRNPGDPIEWTWEAAEKWANRNPETIKKFINNMNL